MSKKEEKEINKEKSIVTGCTPEYIEPSEAIQCDLKNLIAQKIQHEHQLQIIACKIELLSERAIRLAGVTEDEIDIYIDTRDVTKLKLKKAKKNDETQT